MLTFGGMPKQSTVHRVNRHSSGGYPRAWKTNDPVSPSHFVLNVDVHVSEDCVVPLKTRQRIIYRSCIDNTNAFQRSIYCPKYVLEGKHMGNDSRQRS